MSITVNAFEGMLNPLSTIDGVRIACGIPIPNYNLRDVNAAIYGNSITGPDDETWQGSIFRGIYYSSDGAPNTGYGDYTRAKKSSGGYDGNCLYLSSTAAGPATETISIDHRVLDHSIFTEMIDFTSLYGAHTDKPLTFACALDSPGSGMTLGTNFRVYIAQYNSAYGHLQNNEITFEAITLGSYWNRVVGHTTAALDSTTKYVQIHIGIENTSFGLDMMSLMVNPFNNHRAIDGSPEHWLDFDAVHMLNIPSVRASALGMKEMRMLDGSLYRTKMTADSFKLRVGTHWRRENVNTHRSIYAAWLASTCGLGAYVPRPTTLCIDFGIGGMLPFFSYYHAAGATFDGSFNENWTVGSEGYDNGIVFEEV
jgi:hypothetical protein